MQGMNIELLNLRKALQNAMWNFIYSFSGCMPVISERDLPTGLPVFLPTVEAGPSFFITSEAFFWSSLMRGVTVDSKRPLHATAARYAELCQVVITVYHLPFPRALLSSSLKLIARVYPFE